MMTSLIKTYPDVTDSVTVYSMFYLGYHGVFITIYSRLKTTELV